MRKKIRKIIVNDQPFIWRVKQLNAHYVCLVIWPGEHKQTPWLYIRIRADDMWINISEMMHKPEIVHLEFITPRIVAEIIQQCLFDEMKNAKVPIHLERSIKGDLCEIPDANVPGPLPLGFDS